MPIVLVIRISEKFYPVKKEKNYVDIIYNVEFYVYRKCNP